MVDIDIEVSHLLDASLAESTHIVYANAVQSFKNFLNSYGFHLKWPITVNHILRYIAYLSLNGLSSKTTQTYLSALSFYHKVRHLPDPTKDFVVQKVALGYKRNSYKPDVRRPITFDILQKISPALDFVCSSPYETRLFRAAFMLAFFGFLRVGELVGHKHQPDRTLQVNDISVNHHHIILFIRYSKTDQIGKGNTLLISASRNPLLCPVRAITQFLACRPTGSDQLFCHSNCLPMTRYQFTAVLTKALNYVNIPPENFKSHSMRLGAATSCSLNSVPSEQIQAMGRWTSTCYKSYIRINPEMFAPVINNTGF